MTKKRIIPIKFLEISPIYIIQDNNIDFPMSDVPKIDFCKDLTNFYNDSQETRESLNKGLNTVVSGMNTGVNTMISVMKIMAGGIDEVMVSMTGGINSAITGMNSVSVQINNTNKLLQGFVDQGLVQLFQLVAYMLLYHVDPSGSFSREKIYIEYTALVLMIIILLSFMVGTFYLIEIVLRFFGFFFS